MEVLIPWLIIGLLVALVGRNRKIGYGWTLFFCLLLSPLVGLIIALCSKKKGVEFIEQKGGGQTERRRAMKGWAIVLLVIGGSYILISPIWLSGHLQHTEQLTNQLFINQLFISIAFVGGGIYLLRRAAKNKQETQDKEKWSSGEK